MKKFTLLFLSMFCMLGAAVAQDIDDEAFALQYTSPKNGASVFSVNYIQLVFNKDVTVTLPEGGIEVKNTETGEGLKLTRVYEDPYMEKKMVSLFLISAIGLSNSMPIIRPMPRTSMMPYWPFRRLSLSMR